jgi:sugar (pentulose or hexulose) kinase
MISLGIDIGTSAVKVVLMQWGDGAHEVLIAQASRTLAIDRPRPGHSVNRTGFRGGLLA